MKKIITLFGLIVLFAVSSVQAQCCKNHSKSANCVYLSESSQTSSSSDVVAYYFHYTRRCETCKAVEKVSGDALKELYGDKIVLKSINLDEKSSEELAKKMEIDGQTLLVMKGTEKVDLTNDGFLYAVTKPEKLKAKIKSAVDSLK
ncbi:MAG: hypothetical protein KA807_08520 [Prolixibacteraceae bacterium]|nr:hypothetical protein [Prolixibacteraceae bacterium]